MKLNRTPKTGFIGFKEDPSVAERFRQVAKRHGGASRVLQRYVRGYIGRSDRRRSVRTQDGLTRG